MWLLFYICLWNKTTYSYTLVCFAETMQDYTHWRHSYIILWAQARFPIKWTTFLLKDTHHEQIYYLTLSVSVKTAQYINNTEEYYINYIIQYQLQEIWLVITVTPNSTNSILLGEIKHNAFQLKNCIFMGFVIFVFSVYFWIKRNYTEIHCKLIEWNSNYFYNYDWDIQV